MTYALKPAMKLLHAVNEDTRAIGIVTLKNRPSSLAHGEDCPATAQGFL